MNNDLISATFAYIGVLSAFLLFIAVGGFLNNSKIGATCNEDSWHYDSISVVDSIQTALLMVLTAIIWHRTKPHRRSTGHSELSSTESEKRLFTQMILLTFFYMLATVCDWLQHTYSKVTLKTGDIICVDNRFLLVENKKGALFLLTCSVLDFLYTYVIILVFYEVPKRCFGQFR